MSKLKYVGLTAVLLGFIYVIGPKKSYEPVILHDVEIPDSIGEIESWINERESQISDLKTGNEARIIWANDSLKQPTEYSLVYMHGFSASHEEGAPLHTDMAKRYGMNLFLTRLEDHGRLDTNSLKTLTPDNFMYSAEEALKIGQLLGEKVIVMSCSTGGTLSIILAAEGFNIHSMIMYSPNIDIFDKKSDLLLYPYGEKLSEIVMGGQYNKINYDSTAQLYWNPTYHTNGLFVLKSLIQDYMTDEVFKKITVPTFVGYYYKNDKEQDKIVSVERIHDFFDQISTPINEKRKVPFPDAQNHVISSYVMSKDIDNVRNETYRFIDEILQIKSVP